MGTEDNQTTATTPRADMNGTSPQDGVAKDGDTGRTRVSTAGDSSTTNGSESGTRKKTRMPTMSFNRQNASNTLRTVRSVIATIIWVFALVWALILAIGAVLTILDANMKNVVFTIIRNAAKNVDGPFWQLFTFSGKGSHHKEILVNWGIAALVYLVVGGILRRIIRP